MTLKDKVWSSTTNSDWFASCPMIINDIGNKTSIWRRVVKKIPITAWGNWMWKVREVKGGGWINIPILWVITLLEGLGWLEWLEAFCKGRFCWWFVGESIWKLFSDFVKKISEEKGLNKWWLRKLERWRQENELGLLQRALHDEHLAEQREFAVILAGCCCRRTSVEKVGGGEADVVGLVEEHGISLERVCFPRVRVFYWRQIYFSPFHMTFLNYVQEIMLKL